MLGITELGKSPAAQSALNGAGLFVDFFEHEVLKITQRDLLDLPVELVDFFVDSAICQIRGLKALSFQDSDLSVFEVDHLTGVGDQCWRIGSDEHLVVTNTQDDGGAVARYDQAVGLIDAHGDHPIGALDETKRLLDGCLQVTVVEASYQVWNHLCVGV